MNTGKTLFAQLMDFLPWTTVTHIVDRRDCHRYMKSLAGTKQFQLMALAQLAYRENLRDIEVCLSVKRQALSHWTMAGRVSANADLDTPVQWFVDLVFGLDK